MTSGSSTPRPATMQEALARIACLEGELHERDQAVQWRLRNMLAILRSVVRRTSDENGTIEHFRLTLEGRIAALTRVQSKLLSDFSAGLSFFGMIADEMLAAGLAPQAIACRGEDIRLPARAANLFALLVHEIVVAETAGGFDRQEGTVIHVGTVRPNADVPRGVSIEWRFLWRNGPGLPREALIWIEEALVYELGVSIEQHADSDSRTRVYRFASLLPEDGPPRSRS